MSIETFDVDKHLFLLTLTNQTNRKLSIVAARAESSLYNLRKSLNTKVDLMINNIGTKYKNL